MPHYTLYTGSCTDKTRVKRTKQKTLDRMDGWMDGHIHKKREEEEKKDID